jgi:GNAT superfamily N-acetyltransferase
MDLRPIIITHTDTAWHEAFLQFMPQVFPRISFRRWYENGGWTERYRAFAMVEGDRIVANASLSRMQTFLHGREFTGLQLGAVGTLQEARGRGLQDQLIPWLLEHASPGELTYLFGSHRVLDFYPRFGFERVREHLFHADHRAAPGASPVRTLDPASAEDRALLLRVATTARPVTELFGARSYGTTVLWYWLNFTRHRRAVHVPEHDAVLVVDQSDDLLRIYDILAPHRFELSPLLPGIIGAPIARLEFGFTPERYWPHAQPRADYTDSPLFVRGIPPMPDQPFKFPMLAQT